MIISSNKSKNKKIEEEIEIETQNNDKKENQDKTSTDRYIIVKKKNENEKKVTKNNGCIIKMIIYFFLIIFIFIFLGMLSVIVLIGPVINKEKILPLNFPQDLPLYLPQKALIKTQNQTQRQKLYQVLESLPNWFITPFISRLSVDLKGQILLGNNQTRIFDAIALKKSLDSIDQKNIIALKWKKIAKNRKTLEEYYIKKLQESNFSINIEHREQETLIIFSKNKIKGIFIIADNFSSKESSNISLVVAY